MSIIPVSEVRAAIQDLYENEDYQSIENIINDLETLQEKENVIAEDDYVPFQPVFQE